MRPLHATCRGSCIQLSRTLRSSTWPLTTGAGSGGRREPELADTASSCFLWYAPGAPDSRLLVLREKPNGPAEALSCPALPSHWISLGMNKTLKHLQSGMEAVARSCQVRVCSSNLSFSRSGRDEKAAHFDVLMQHQSPRDDP